MPRERTIQSAEVKAQVALAAVAASLKSNSKRMAVEENRRWWYLHPLKAT
jgi:hypothetical protein